MTAVTRSLATVEVGRLLRNPFVWLGLGGTTALTLDVSNATDAARGAMIYGLAISFVLLPVLCVIAGVAATRDRPSGTDEFLGSLPRGARWDRARGQLLAIVGFAVFVGLVHAILATVIYPDSGSIALSSGRSVDLDPIHVVQGPYVLAAVTIFCAALGWRYRHPIPAILVPVLLVFTPVAWFVPLGLAPAWDWGDGTSVDAGAFTSMNFLVNYLHLLSYVLIGLALLGRMRDRPRIESALLLLLGLGLFAVGLVSIGFTGAA